MRLLFTPVGPHSGQECGPFVVDTDPEVLHVEVVEYPATTTGPSASDRFRDTGTDPVIRPLSGPWRAVVGDLDDARYMVVCPRCWSLRSVSLGPGVTVRVLGERPADARCAVCEPDDA